MKNKYIEILELDKIKNEAKSFAATNMGKEVITNLNPNPNINYVKQSLEEVTAAGKLVEEFGLPSFGGVRDLREILKKANKGIVLSSKELMDIRNTLTGFKSLKNYFNNIVENLDSRIIENYYSLVINEGKKIVLLPALERELVRCLDDYGDIKDSASPRLASIRSEITKFANRIRGKMDNIVKSSRFQTMLQDNLVTKRRDRYVVPVKSKYRNHFQGIVHDQSASGLTLFMEPLAIVKMNNNLSELESEEEKEIYKILKDLTALVEDQISIIQGNLKTTTFLDLIFARSEYSRQIGGIEPEINDQGIISIKEGRHPLLRENAVPIDIEVGGDFSTLIITGPNTGGKTVALKTVGLFVLMVECGFHVPVARGTELAIFKKVFVDIGDEQSIEQNLSTFSSHMNRIKDFINKADKDSLVLMDELGAGTDPKEGAALGIAIMEKLGQKKAITIVTTHYSQLKNYAYDQKGVENASVEFNINTLKPTYRILMGVPGGSNAFAIAQKLGIPEEIVGKARELLSDDEVKVENIISALNIEREKYSELKNELLLKEKEVSNLKKKYGQLLNYLKDEKKKIISKARGEAAEIVNTARSESKAILQELKKTNFNSRSEIDRMGNEINEEFKIVDQFLSKEEREEEDNTVEEKFSVGDEVRLISAGSRGQVTEIDKDKGEATIQVGIMTVKASLDDLMKVDMPEIKNKKLVRKYKITKGENVSPSLDLRGERYDSAQRILDKYLDDVFLAGLKQVEIIHGKGTGALREAVQIILKDHKHVAEYRLGRQEEGGMGVSIVSLL